MADDEEDQKEQASAATAKTQTASGMDLAKLIGGAILVIASTGLMIHRMPHRQYVAVHEDKPRPRRPAVDTDSPEAPSAPKASAKPAAVAVKSGAPAAKPGAPSKSVDGQPFTLVAPEKAPVIDLAEACAAEAPLLCYHVSDSRLPRCLRGYEDYLRKSCLDALPDSTASRR